MEKVILITGGSRGIGAATAILAGKESYKVCVNYRENVQAANAVVEEILRAGGTAMALRGDVASEGQIISLFEQIDKKYGRVTALVNNAGILEKQSPVLGMDSERLMRIFLTNSIAPFICAREAIKRMSRKNGGAGGAIVNVSSTAIKQGGPFEYVDYAASKASLEVFTLGLAKEVASEGICVNAVRPGIVYTDIHASGGEPGRVDRVKNTIPMQRGGHPQEVAKAILWLLSEEASYCSGSILDVSGGR
jgi:NAD(P)-dependent dehydrogenase (short-subunit alcohol dehydrogenase family)